MQEPNPFDQYVNSSEVMPKADATDEIAQRIAKELGMEVERDGDSVVLRNDFLTMSIAVAPAEQYGPIKNLLGRLTGRRVTETGDLDEYVASLKNKMEQMRSKAAALTKHLHYRDMLNTDQAAVAAEFVGTHCTQCGHEYTNTLDVLENSYLCPCTEHVLHKGCETGHIEPLPLSSSFGFFYQ